MKRWIATTLLFNLTACSYKPEDPGLCKLNCSNAIIAGNDTSMSITLQTATQSIACPAAAAGQPISDALFVQFLVAEAFDNGGEVAGQRPVPNISVEPIVNGLRSDLPKDNPNVEINGDVFSPARYKGILTPKDNWCADSCGIVTVEVAAACPPVGTSSDLSVQMHSGALYSVEPAVFTISTQDDTN